LTLWAGVGSVVVVDAAEPVMLIVRSLVLGENWEGLCGVWGWQDMMDRGCAGAVMSEGVGGRCENLGAMARLASGGDPDKENPSPRRSLGDGAAKKPMVG
jgi:hypothetical protein